MGRRGPLASPRPLVALLAAVLVALPPAQSADPASAATESFQLRVPVLIYHHVVCDGTSGVPNTQIWICPTRFQNQLTYLRDRGWRTITTDELADAMRDRRCPGARRFVVTIDDSASVGYTNAAPILEALGMRATYFVVVGLAGHPNALTFGQMRDLRGRGHGIGNHTMTHLDLVGRSQSALYREVEQSQQKLAAELGFRPRTFAYPNGTYDGPSITRVAQSGFELAFTAEPTFTLSADRPLLAPRLFVSRRHSPSDLAAKIEPYADPCAGSGPAAGAPKVILPGGTRTGTAKARIRVDWSAGAPSGASFQLQQRRNGGSWTTVSLPSPRQTAINLLRAPGNTFQYRVRAASGGSYGAWATGPPYQLLARQENHASISRTAGWTRVSQSSAFGGALMYATSSTARASLTFSGSSIGWVAPRGPKRGVVDVYVDGALAATVNLYASSGQPRRLVFVREWASKGTHTIELRVRGTSGRPRADLDAFVVLVP